MQNEISQPSVAQPKSKTGRPADWLWPIALVIAVTLLSVIIARSSVDLNAVREAARQGTLDALAQKSVSDPALVAPAAQSPATITTTFQLRAANRQGRAGAGSICFANWLQYGHWKSANSTIVTGASARPWRLAARN